MPSWKELKRFCERDGWELYKSTDHDFYRKIDKNGNLRFTKVSRCKRYNKVYRISPIKYTGFRQKVYKFSP